MEKKHRTLEEYLQTKEVECIPWIHDNWTLEHKEVVGYIRKLPKNSFLALEITHEDLNIFTQMIEDYKIPKKIFNDEMIDVLLECKKRNIKIIPLETKISREKYDKKVPFREEKFKVVVEANIEREKTMNEQIIAALKTHRIKKLFVLTGIGHTAALQYRLKKAGIKSKIETRIFSERDSMLHSLQMVRKTRKAFMDGNLLDAEKYYQEAKQSLGTFDPLLAIAKKKSRPDLLNLLEQRIKRKMQQHRITQQKRLQTRRRKRNLA